MLRGLRFEEREPVLNIPRAPSGYLNVNGYKIKCKLQFLGYTAQVFTSITTQSSSGQRRPGRIGHPGRDRMSLCSDDDKGSASCQCPPTPTPRQVHGAPAARSDNEADFKVC